MSILVEVLPFVVPRDRGDEERTGRAEVVGPAQLPQPELIKRGGRVGQSWKNNGLEDDESPVGQGPSPYGCFSGEPEPGQVPLQIGAKAGSGQGTRGCAGTDGGLAGAAASSYCMAGDAACG